MDSPSPSRRDFISASASLLGGGWLALQLPIIASIAACARDAAGRSEPFVTLTPAEARTMAALGARIIPSDDALPGATEAGAVYFVDRALGSHFRAMHEPIRGGLADLDERARRRRQGATSFADLDAAAQDGLIGEVESTPFFGFARMLTVMGVIADPSYGGNRDGAGARLLAMEHRPAYAPPFGWYDADAVGARAARNA